VKTLDVWVIELMDGVLNERVTSDGAGHSEWSLIDLMVNALLCYVISVSNSAALRRIQHRAQPLQLARLTQQLHPLLVVDSQFSRCTCETTVTPEKSSVLTRY